MKPSTPLTDIPRTGRIGRFAKIVESKASTESFLKIMDKSDEYGKYKAEKKAHWWKLAIKRLESELGPEEAVEVMTACGSKCCGQGQRKTARKMMLESSSVEEFLVKLSEYQVKEGELEYKLVDKHTIIGKHNRCFCGQVKKATELHNTNTYCQCSVEFNRQFFEAAFDMPAEVKLKQSILNGDYFCEFEIKVKGELK